MKRHLGSYISRIFLITVLLTSALSVYASNPTASPLQEGEGLWIEAVGQAYQGEIETSKEIKERAKRDAESKAIEQATGAFVKAHTLVSNYQIAEDFIHTAVRGKIEKLEIIKEGWDEKDRNIYKVYIKALVEPIYPEKGEGGLSVRLSLSKTDLKEGDAIKILYQANADCYVYIFSVAADGSVTLLMPNAKSKDNYIKGGEAYSFPAEGSGLQVLAQFLPGYEKETAAEYVKIIATRQKEELLKLSFQEGLFKVYDAKSTGMISDLQKNLSKIEPTDWTEATESYTLKRGILKKGGERNE